MSRHKIPQLVDVEFTCDLCRATYTEKRPETRWKELPPDWGIVEREGGGHYGLPIHELDACPNCYMKEKRKNDHRLG